MRMLAIPELRVPSQDALPVGIELAGEVAEQGFA
jgi:hypothetical protein